MKATGKLHAPAPLPRYSLNTRLGGLRNLCWWKLESFGTRSRVDWWTVHDVSN